MYIDNIISINEIRVRVEKIERRRITGDISFDNNHFKLIFTYNDDIYTDENIAGLILTMPVINFTYFTGKLILDYPTSADDLDIIKKFIKINAREVFINKIINRRYDFIKEEYIPKEEDINEYNASGITEVIATVKHNGRKYPDPDKNNTIIMSSGGKESLLGYGIFNEINVKGKNFSYFFEESGSHWLTAKTAYDYYIKNFENVRKTWSNIDRFYHEMMKYIKILKIDKINIRADDYPLQVFIFPVYIFSIIPYLIKNSIGNIIMGDEFDDPRNMGDFHGIKYYYGIFDQTYDFNRMMTQYFKKKNINSKVYSIVYPITGYVEEKILERRYHDLYLNQRSCHSCHERDHVIYPCGKCTKCMGILLFIEANGNDPSEILYSDGDKLMFKKRVFKSRLRLDPDEINFTEMKLGYMPGDYKQYNHVDGIHILPFEDEPLLEIPGNFRDSIYGIFQEYTNGIYKLNEGQWSKI